MGLFSKKKTSDSTPPRRQAPGQGERSAVFSYYAKSANSSRESSRLPTDQRRLRPTDSVQLGKQHYRSMLRNAPVILALLVVVCGIIYNTTLNTNAQVITAGQQQEDVTLLRDKSTYQDAVNEALNSDIASRSKLTINTQAIADKMVEQFPELSDVSVTLPLLGTRPVVHLTATSPKLLLISGQNGYVLDGRGIVLMDAKDLSADTPLIRVVDQSGLAIEKGNAALSAEQVAYIQEVNRQLAAKQLTVKEMVLPAEPLQLNVYLEGERYYGKFLLLSDSRAAAGTFIATHKKLQSDRIVPREYIDVRVEERAYYK